MEESCEKTNRQDVSKRMEEEKWEYQTLKMAMNKIIIVIILRKVGTEIITQIIEKKMKKKRLKMLS